MLGFSGRREHYNEHYNVSPIILNIPSSLEEVGTGQGVLASNLEHLFCKHAFFFLPGPPYLGLSLQNLHVSQSVARQPLHSPHLLRLVPEETR